MNTVYVSFASDAATIVTACAIQQDPPMTAITTDDARWKSYYNSFPKYLQAVWPAPASSS